MFQKIGASEWPLLGPTNESEVIGQPHSLLRHPDMPRCIFKLLWSELETGNEIFAYVKNRTKNGDHYWVNAHVTPSRDSSGQVIGYHSTRRLPERRVIDDVIIPLYKDLRAEEERHANRKDGMEASLNMVMEILQDRDLDYDKFIQTL